MGVFRLAAPLGGLPAGTIVALPGTGGGLGGGIPAGFPRHSDVGIPAGTTLTSAGVSTASDPQWRSSAAGQVVDAVDFENRRVLIQHDNVTIRRSRVRSRAECKVQVVTGVRGVVIEDCDIAGISDTDNGTGVGYGDYTARRNWVHRVEDAFRVGARTVVEDNLTDEQSIGLLSTTTGERLHTDGVQFNACANGPGEQTIVRHNTLLAVRTDGTKGNSAIIVGCENNDVAHVLIEGNYVSNGSYSIYAKGQENGHTIADVVIRGNVYAGDAKYGDLIYQPDATGYTITAGGGTRKGGAAASTAQF